MAMFSCNVCGAMAFYAAEGPRECPFCEAAREPDLTDGLIEQWRMEAIAAGMSRPSYHVARRAVAWARRNPPAAHPTKDDPKP